MKNENKEIFEIEMEGWCYGIAHYPGEVYPDLVHYIIRELAHKLDQAVKNNVIFDIVSLSRDFSKAAKYLVSEKDIVSTFLSILPDPSKLNEQQMLTLAKIVDNVEKSYAGTTIRMRQIWASKVRAAA